MVSNPLGFILYPQRQWQQVASSSYTKFGTMMLYPIIMALVPCFAWYYGTTTMGWGIGEDGETTRLTPESAIKMIAAFYVVMLISIYIVGSSIHWMASTYGSESTICKGIAIASFSATPLFIAGIIGLQPEMWIDLVVSLAALGWATYLLYIGIPIVMDIPKERGFLFASAVIAVCMVVVIGIMCGSVILWDMGFMPVFTD